MWICWLWAASKYWKKILQRPVTRTIMKWGLIEINEFLLTEHYLCFHRFDYYRFLSILYKRHLFFWKLKVKIKHIRNVREKVQPTLTASIYEEQEFSKYVCCLCQLSLLQQFQIKITMFSQGTLLSIVIIIIFIAGMSAYTVRRIRLTKQFSLG